MVNRYAGTCAQCGARVPAKGGTVRRKGRRWVVEHIACASSKAPAVHTFNIGGKEYIRNARGTCEDAPCCGCCTI